jgi:AcrR family transcriptional regulator
VGYKHSREDLLAAAVRLAETSGIGSLTFGSVGASLGISDRTVVYYFPTKADMITSVIAALGEQLQSALADAFGEQALPVEEKTCRPFLIDRLAALPRLKVIVTLGDVSRKSVLKALGAPASAMTAGHGVQAIVGPYTLINSYHCSRLNTNTGRLTPAMFEDIFRRARAVIEG